MRVVFDTSVLIGSARPDGYEWGRLAAAVVARGGQPRRRAMDLVIAATANASGVPLLTHNVADFQIIDDLVQVVPTTTG
jgi:predicted nucleic acid-binding protein